jgi:integrase
VASVREQKTGWAVRFYDAARRPKTARVTIPKVQFPRERDADREAERLQGLYDYSASGERQFDPWVQDWPGADEATGAGGTTLREAVRAYCRHKRRLGKKDLRGGWNEGTEHRNRSQLEDFAERSGGHRLTRDLTQKDAERFLFRDELAPATKRSYRRTLATFLRWLDDEGLAASAEDLLPPQFKRRKKRKTLVYPNELGALCRVHRRICVARCLRKHAPRTGANSGLARLWMAMAWRFAFYQCLRRAETLQLKVGAIDTRRWQMHVGDEDFLPKGRSEDTIRITPPARPIAAYLTTDADGRPRDRSEHLFPAQSASRYYESFKQAVRGIDPGDFTLRGEPIRGAIEHKPGASPHSLRHGGITYWLDEGKSYRWVKYLARHASVTTTETYDSYTLTGGYPPA